MHHDQPAEEFGLETARRALAEVLAPWVLAEARVARLGRTMSFGRYPLERRRQRAGRDGLERLCHAAIVNRP